MDFKVVLERDEDGYVIATVPSLPGCISQGKTEEEALKNVREAIHLHIKTLARRFAAFRANSGAGKTNFGVAMSQKLPVLSGKELVKIMEKFGYYIRSQQGSHIHLRHPVHPPLTIPNHKEIARGTLRTIIRQAGFGLKQFLEILR